MPTEWFDAPAQTIAAAAVAIATATTGSPTEPGFDDARNSPTGAPVSTGVAAVASGGGYYVSQDKLAIRWTPLTSLLVPYIDWSLAGPGETRAEIEVAGTGVSPDSPLVNWPISLGWITSAEAAIDYAFDTGAVDNDGGTLDAFVHSNALTFGGDGAAPAEIDEWFVGDSFLGTLSHPTPFVAGIRDSATVPAGTDLATLTVPLNSADIGVNFGLVDRDAWSLIVVTTENAWTGEVPGGITTPSGIQMLSDGTADVTVHFQPPRFRFHQPPQRQYPRDDGLGISTRRSWPPPSTRQYGLRRGPVSTVL